MEKKSVCKLCKQTKCLQKSHIIPRSYFKSLKSGHGQLVSIICDEDSIPKISNVDPKESLLCRECEQFISVNYERYGTRLFKSGHGVKRKKSYIELSGFKYTEYYLFLITILWRASVSTLDDFSNVKLGTNIEDLLANCIQNKSIKIKTSLKLDHFIRISVLRVVDSSGNVDDDIIKKMMISFGCERGDSVKNGIMYYFMVDGFLIGYFLSTEKDIHKIRTFKMYAQLNNRPEIKIPKAEIKELKQINDALNSAIIQCQKHP
ncbi:hypothetical protein [Aliivibrio fischeri]|uniref:hypothetical protein n=1 Tax=Aliivibrio fischeri TaxID=668 RepID=UPI001F349D25|nr:hypothetical protein [Aliivibrio fischeri]